LKTAASATCTCRWCNGWVSSATASVTAFTLWIYRH